MAAAEEGRYHLYISYGCPFCQRVMIARKLKGLEEVIPMTALDPYLDRSTGWRFVEKEGQISGCSPDPLYGFRYLRELYLKSDPDYKGKIELPVLFDHKHGRIVSNSSGDILRLFNKNFNAFAKNPSLDVSPPNLLSKIDEMNSWIAPSINNGVYQCGFAKSQKSYDEAVEKLFASLERVEAILSKDRYLLGDVFTEADIRLFTTLLRFDPVYLVLFKCCKKMVKDYPNTFAYVREIYQMPGVKDTFKWDHIKIMYFQSSKEINPHGIIPIGPVIDFDAPHNRAKEAVH